MFSLTELTLLDFCFQFLGLIEQRTNELLQVHGFVTTKVCKLFSCTAFVFFAFSFVPVSVLQVIHLPFTASVKASILFSELKHTYCSDFSKLNTKASLLWGIIQRVDITK